MKKLTFRKEYNTTDNFLSTIENKKKKQNRIYSSFFIILILLIISYILYGISVEKVDGYIHCKSFSVHLADDVLISELKAKPGDYFNEGETLFSCVYINWLNDAANPNITATPLLRSIEHKQDIEKNKSKLKQEKRSADSIKNIINKIEKEIKLGISTSAELEDKKWEYLKIEEEIDHIKNLIKIDSASSDFAMTKYSFKDTVRTMGYYTYRNRPHNNKDFGEAYRIKVAFTDLKIIDIKTNVGDIVYKGETILTYLPYNKPELTDLHIKAIIPAERLEKIRAGERFKATIGNEILSTVTLSVSTSYMNNTELEDGKIKDNSVIMRVNFPPGYTLPTKYMIDKLPVTLKNYKWRTLKSDNIIRKIMDFLFLRD